VKLVVPDIWTFEDMRVGRAYLVEDDRGLAMIDSSEPGKFEAIEREIKQIDRRIDDVHTIVVTHWHTDHAGNGEQIRQRTGATVYAHPVDAGVIDGRTSRPERDGFLERLSGKMAKSMDRYTIDHEIGEGSTVPIAGGLRVIETPGHTAGHISLVWPERRVLFAGDAFGNYFGLRRPFWLSTEDMAQARASIYKLAGLDFDHALPGHGNPVINHAGEKVRMWAQRWVKKPQ
jgi:glyoxylase-like metal-dependent hydrolase (beta-lactamase superfamily II)